jgi:hypothetical protein
MFGGIIGSIVGSVVSNVVSGLAGSLINGMIGQFGGSNFFGALTNLALNSLGDALKGVINNAPLPQFLKDAANTIIDGVIGNNQQATTPEAQEAVDNSSLKDAFQAASESVAKDLEEEASGEGKNWLVALAGALSEVQGKFLKEALENMDTMKDLAGDEDSSHEFLTAQSEYQANMQMFNMMANASGTSLKSIGEGLTALARKQ